MNTVYLEDSKTGIEYKATIKEELRAFDYGFTGRGYQNCFVVNIYKPIIKIFWFKFYRKVITRYRTVKDVELVSDYVVEVFKAYLKGFAEFRREVESFRFAEKAREDEMRKKYDSLPHKITIE